LAELLKRFLIVRTDRIGDVILTLPMAKAVKKQFPDAYIVMLIRRYTTELVEDDQNVDKILFYDDSDRLVPFFQLVASMRAQQFDVVFHTHPRFRLALITWLARIPIRAGTGYRWYSFLFNRKIYEHRKDAKRHELEYNLNLLTTIGCTVDPASVAPILEVKIQSIQKVRDILNRIGALKILAGSVIDLHSFRIRQLSSLAAGTNDFSLTKFIELLDRLPWRWSIN
jgi:ADP-heptose:LPS heptosyltransferase